MEQWMFNIFSGGGVLIIGFLAWIARSMIKNTEGLTHLREEVREDVKRLETQINRIDTRFESQITRIDARFESQINRIDTQIGRIDTQINHINTRLDYIFILNKPSLAGSLKHDDA